MRAAEQQGLRRPGESRDPSPLTLIVIEGICNTAKTRVLGAAMSAIALTLGSRRGGRDGVGALFGFLVQTATL
jgi:hypothetical protein